MSNNANLPSHRPIQRTLSCKSADSPKILKDVRKNNSKTSIEAIAELLYSEKSKSTNWNDMLINCFLTYLSGSGKERFLQYAHSVSQIIDDKMPNDKNPQSLMQILMMGIYTCLKSLIMKNPITSTLWNVFERVISSLLNALIKGSNIDIDEPNINVDDDDHKEQPNNININDDPYEDHKVQINDPKDHNNIISKPPVSMVNHPCQPLHHKIEISIINNNNNNNNPNTPKDHNTPESSSKTEKRNISNGKEVRRKRKCSKCGCYGHNKTTCKK
ncbi:uncharacterized protein LOC115721058 [Cannabis sativa]|uniref:uncharacterized protein LOC115721058 n=1 Tax=Cannabis sativa TaxID=3483 RepID=UPI0029CA8632|nr:uncharacterized protein LOC115721058 [Cannabis sativa]